MTQALTTKRTKTGDVQPPKEIRENTKARRAWLAAEVARLNAEPNTEAKIVGTGSYQRISVYTVTQVEGRLRQRGVCQCCGNAQVVDGGVLVLHGYNRPGDGAIIGRCPGMDEKPLNVEKRLTEAWHADAITRHVIAEEALEAAKQEEHDARQALYSKSGEVEFGSWNSKPRQPDTWRLSAAAKVDAGREYRAQMAVWAAQFPLHGRVEAAEYAHSVARNTEWQWRQTRDHFAALLASGTYGSPLIDEVVA
jgi:hypothetical protein